MSRPRLIALLLALITLAAYLPVMHDSFSNFDDGDYVTGNRVVPNGLTWAGVKWAFTTWHASNWHPLTWLSHMLDCELFGLNAGAQHYVSVLFHTANAVLLLLLLFRLTGTLWPSALVAALFAWHPLHVESVAWIAERKDVLSTFFGLLALLAYTRYAQKNSKIGYCLALFFFAFGLMAKPMLVTLPFVMLLLDYWPLRRIPNFEFRISNALRLVFEKWPFFLLAAASCVVTFLAQRNGGMVTPLQQFPLDLRLGNALLSYALYLGKAIWPARLAVVYPLQSQLPWAEAAVAGVLLMIITWLAWRAQRQCPYLLVGWFWFLGILVPVIGLVQVGGQVLADHYTYVPLIGIFVAITFGLKDLIARFKIGVVPPAAAAGLILASCLVFTERQLSYWRNDETLFSHAITVTKNNGDAHNNLAVALEQQGRYAEALAEYRAAERIDPGSYKIHYNLGNLFNEMGKSDEALVQYREALKLNPKAPPAHDNLGMLLVKLGRFDEAMNQYEQAAWLDPDDPRPYYLMGKALLKQGRDAEAIDQFREALQLGPDNFQILAYTAYVLAASENPKVRDGKTALELAAKANALTGGAQPGVLDALSMACAETGRFKNAQQIEQRAIRLAQAAGLKETNAMLQRLELYKSGLPYRETFTNSPPRNLPKK